MSEVFELWRVFPLTRVAIRSEFGFGISSLVTIAGPSGAKVSKLFPRQNCPPPKRFCQSRALTSLAAV
jgi:hypothetical protein